MKIYKWSELREKLAPERLARLDSSIVDERAREKQLSREKDEENLKSGAKTKEQLYQENYWFHSLKFRVNFADAKKLA